jgi:hypothetical protein
MNEGKGSVSLSQPVRTVAFTCDFLRFSLVDETPVSFQPRNLRWLREMLAAPLRHAAPDLVIRDVLPPMTGASFALAAGDTAELDDYRQDPEAAWARRYDAAQLTLFPGVLAELCEHDLVIGFELPPSLKRYLYLHDRAYLSFCVHPLRFLRDLCFGVTTNEPHIAMELRKCEINPQEVERQVHRFCALFRRRQLAACAIPRDLPVLIGQTERDSVLIKEDRFDTWEHHSDALDRLIAPYDALVFIEHPLRASSATAAEHLRSHHGKAVVTTNANGYGVLMSNPAIPKVITLASSLGVEAEAIGLETQFLSSDPRRKFVVDTVDQPGGDAANGHAVMGVEFWRAILAGVGSTVNAKRPTNKPRDDFVLGEHYIRNSLESWSYRALQFGLDIRPARKTFLQSDGLEPARRNQLLGGLLSFEQASELEPRDAIRQARLEGLQLHLLDPPVRSGEMRAIAMGSPASGAYLAEGFHALESWGVWSSALCSSMVFPVARTAVAQRTLLRVTLKLQAYESLLPSAPVLRIDHLSSTLAYVFFRSGERSTQSVVVEFPVHSTLERLHFELTALESPASRGKSTDARWLGFALHEIEVVCVPDDPQRKQRSCTLWGILPESVQGAHTGVAGKGE